MSTLPLPARKKLRKGGSFFAREGPRCLLVILRIDLEETVTNSHSESEDVNRVAIFDNLPYQRFTGKTIGKNYLPVTIGKIQI